VTALEEAVGLAVKGGDAKSLELLFSQRPPEYDADREGGGRGGAMWLEDDNGEEPECTLWSLSDLLSAAQSGHVDCIDFAVKHCCPWWDEVCTRHLRYVSCLKLFGHFVWSKL
jgi:hypothetical protein